MRDSLGIFNVAVTGDSYYSPLAIFLKDERGAVLGGVLGHHTYHVLKKKLLQVRYLARMGGKLRVSLGVFGWAKERKLRQQ